jgi:hypothetical protein
MTQRNEARRTWRARKLPANAQEKAAHCAALKVVGPHGFEPWTKGL